MCRDEKLPESKVLVIPDGAGAQTSFGDQLTGTDGLGCMLIGVVIYTLWNA